ncbi:MAG: hypothetical protein ACREGD_03290 [Candidatus Saccharimonadales bacterium]
MKKVYLLLIASVVTSALVFSGLTGTAMAWHPVGKIDKKVQNVSASGTPQDADTTTSAVDTKSNDVIKYIVKVWNEGQPNQQGHNDMVDIVVTDTLPTGVELVSDPTKRELKETINRLRPGESKTFEYAVKVTRQDDGFVKKRACFTGDSEVKDAPQKGCNDAVIKVKKVVTPPPTPPQTPPQTPAPPQVLPVTGAGSIAGLFAGVSGLGYIAHRFLNRQK